jgi:hypothetical protein
MLTTGRENLKRSLEYSFNELKRLRDEIRVQVHLGGLELKKTWQELEPSMERAEAYLQEVTEVSEKAMHDLLIRARQLRAEVTRIAEQNAVRRH